MDEAPIRLVADYAGQDAWLPWLLRPILAGMLAEARLDELFHSLELPLIGVLAELEHNGIKVDVARLGELSRRFGQRMESVELEIRQIVGRPLNLASPKQLQQLLFRELKLPVVRKSPKGDPSTDADVLEELARLHPLPAKILEYRQYAKLKSTYVDALPTMICPATGRVHASFHQAVAATGRLSSSDPNLQNIPVRTKEGREIRSAFVADPEGWLLLAADYSQIELRVLAHYSGDRQLSEAFARDEDIHARVASQVASVPLAEVTPEMRRAAKAVNFGVIYGQSPFGLARAWESTRRPPPSSLIAILRGIRGSWTFWIGTGRMSADRVCDDDSRPPAGNSRHSGASWPPAQPGRTDGHQHGDSGVGGRPDQAGHGRHPPPLAKWPLIGENVTTDSRRVDLRSSRLSTPRFGPACYRRNGCGLPERSLESGHQGRTELGGDAMKILGSWAAWRAERAPWPASLRGLGAAACWMPAYRCGRRTRYCGCRRSRRRRGGDGEKRYLGRMGKSIGSDWPASCSPPGPTAVENGSFWSN